MPQSRANSLGVFELADESLDEPLQELAQATQNNAEIAARFYPLKIGQSILPEWNRYSINAYWREAILPSWLMVISPAR